MAVTTPEHVPSVPQEPMSTAVTGKRRLLAGTRLPAVVTGAAALVPLIALVAIIAVLYVKAYPAVRVNGWGFLVRKSWVGGNEYGTPVKRDGTLVPVGASYGALPLVLGTLATSLI